jgi:hypothetical protein
MVKVNISSSHMELVLKLELKTRINKILKKKQKTRKKQTKKTQTHLMLKSSEEFLQ